MAERCTLRRLRRLVRHTVGVGAALHASQPTTTRASTTSRACSTAAAAADALFASVVRRDEPGCAVCVVREGVTLYSRGHGLASLEHSVPIYPECTVFDIGSVSKQFTAAAVAQLALDGKLSLDDPVSKHIRQFPDYGAPLRVSHLLHHTSGVRDYLTTMALAGRQSENVFTEKEVVEMICRQQNLNFLPGDEYLYLLCSVLTLCTVSF